MTPPLAVLLILAAALTLAGCGAGDTRAPGEVRLDTPDLVISAYQGAETLGGDEVALSTLLAQGKPVVVNFWAALCPPCRAEMPDFQEVAAKRAHEVTVLGVDIGPQVLLGSREQGQALLAELGITYPAGTTFDDAVTRNFKVLGMPTTLFFYPDGRLLRSWSGLMPREKLEELIDQLLAG
ncbi:MAG: TlpA disulfide reductase family protein [Chloroflexota bacterium]